jgi:hypothetical protein
MVQWHFCRLGAQQVHVFTRGEFVSDPIRCIVKPASGFVSSFAFCSEFQLSSKYSQPLSATFSEVEYELRQPEDVICIKYCFDYDNLLMPLPPTKGLVYLARFVGRPYSHRENTKAGICLYFIASQPFAIACCEETSSFCAHCI